MTPAPTANQLSEQLLLAVKMANSTKELVQSLAAFPFETLQSQLSNDTQKKAFWINIYNAYFQILAKEQQVKKPAIYRDALTTIAGKALSLDDIEHGILRRYRWKFSLGYLPNIFTPKLIKRLAVTQIDYRIHFALNCGAKSCPPIAFYNVDRLDAQLDMASGSFLEGETQVDEANKTIKVTALFQWFAADFGGKRGLRNILKKHIDLSSDGYKISYLPYSWEEDLGYFVEHS